MEMTVNQSLECPAPQLSGRRLDFTRPFLPEALAATEPLTFLSPVERLTLNHIRGYGYLHLQQVVKERILVPTIEQTRGLLAGDAFQTSALDRLLTRETRHIALIEDLRAEFERGFGSPCSLIGPPAALARAVLAHHPLGVALALHHAAWLGERHYDDCVRDPRSLDSRFRSLLRLPWQEEARRERFESLVARARAVAATPLEAGRGIDDYADICALTAAGLEQQVRFDLESLVRAMGRELSGPERDAFLAVQRRATRWTWLGGGLRHPEFLSTLERLGPAARARAEGIASEYC
jgi:hypothetical protein